MDFPKFFEMKYLEWQQKEGGRRTVTEFAAYLGIAQTSASAYILGKRKPEGESLTILAQKLGLEIYDSLGIPRPDEGIFYIQSIWNDLSPKARRALLEKAREYKTKNEPK